MGLKSEEKYSIESISPVNWYIAGILLRFEVVGVKELQPNNRFLSWENKHLIKAETPDEAYEKALKLGKESEDDYINPDGENVRWVFEGLTGLLPIYEELEDGAEIIWIKRENKTLKTIRKLAKNKEELEVFSSR
ncbi:MAG TPA: DUF4288 domain-containing protein [Pyrinomonadaceae bacterium]|nr:DUF4288 domain-containing protein [Pyrinomonadaceae bacterium]